MLLSSSRLNVLIRTKLPIFKLNKLSKQVSDKFFSEQFFWFVCAWATPKKPERSKIFTKEWMRDKQTIRQLQWPLMADRTVVRRTRISLLLLTPSDVSPCDNCQQSVLITQANKQKYTRKTRVRVRWRGKKQIWPWVSSNTWVRNQIKTVAVQVITL